MRRAARGCLPARGVQPAHSCTTPCCRHAKRAAAPPALRRRAAEPRLPSRGCRRVPLPRAGEGWRGLERLAGATAGAHLHGEYVAYDVPTM